MSLTDELAFVLLAIKEADTDARYGLILKALALANMCGYEAGIRIDPQEPEWPVVFIELPTGQVGWTIPQHSHKWDGHTTDDKWRRIEEFAEFVGVRR